MATTRETRPIDPEAAATMLAASRIAVVGASDDRGNFGRTIYLALRDRGSEPVAVHPTATTVAGGRCHPTLADIPEPVDVAIVVVAAPASVEIVRECAANGIGMVWLFKGLGGPGAASEEAVRVAHELGLEVVAGACPMMFLEPVGWFHRLHRAARRGNGSLVTVG